MVKSGKIEAQSIRAVVHPACHSSCPTCQGIITRRKRNVAKLDKKKIPRNSKCYCGSGQKYKSCCLKKDEYEEVMEKLDKRLAATGAKGKGGLRAKKTPSETMALKAGSSSNSSATVPPKISNSPAVSKDASVVKPIPALTNNAADTSAEGDSEEVNEDELPPLETVILAIAPLEPKPTAQELGDDSEDDDDDDDDFYDGSEWPLDSDEPPRLREVSAAVLVELFPERLAEALAKQKLIAEGKKVDSLAAKPVAAEADRDVIPAVVAAPASAPSSSARPPPHASAAASAEPAAVPQKPEQKPVEGVQKPVEVVEVRPVAPPAVETKSVTAPVISFDEAGRFHFDASVPIANVVAPVSDAHGSGGARRRVHMSVKIPEGEGGLEASSPAAAGVVAAATTPTTSTTGNATSSGSAEDSRRIVRAKRVGMGPFASSSSKESVSESSSAAVAKSSNPSSSTETVCVPENKSNNNDNHSSSGEATAAAATVGNVELEARTLWERGDSMCELGRVLEGITFYSQAILSINGQITNGGDKTFMALRKKELGLVYLARGRAFQTLGLPSRSRSDCLRAVECFEGLSDEVLRATPPPPPPPAQKSKAPTRDLGPPMPVREGAAAEVKNGAAPLSFDRIAELQSHVQPLLASIVSLREWIAQDKGSAISKEFGGLMGKLKGIETEASNAVTLLQKASLAHNK